VSDLRITERAGEVRVTVRAQPRASRDAVVGVHDGALKIAITAPPVDGEANAAIVAFIAKKLGVAKRAVRVVSGDSSREKVLAIEGVTADSVRALANG
jgi:uncharacterized protein (TIGR00251 family)